MTLIYLDYNCFQRGFDDPRQIRIQMESAACQEIFIQAQTEKITLAWSFIHEDETNLCPFLDRKYSVLGMVSLCKIKVPPKTEIAEQAILFQQLVNLSSKDALHLACAVSIQADFFLTCDDSLKKQAQKLELEIAIMNPIDYIRNNENYGNQ